MMLIYLLTSYIELASYTDIGKIREKNEDSVIIAPELCLGAVADGMGGHNAGEVASNLAVSILRQTIADVNAKKIVIPRDFEPALARIQRKLLYAILRRDTDCLLIVVTVVPINAGIQQWIKFRARFVERVC
jgi:serine/threonine protein phosphatase PrpC